MTIVLVGQSPHGDAVKQYTEVCWYSHLAGRSYPQVILALPVSQPFSEWHSSYRQDPAALCMQPSTETQTDVQRQVRPAQPGEKHRKA